MQPPHCSTSHVCRRNYAVSRRGVEVSLFRIENACRRAKGMVCDKAGRWGRSAALLIACSVLREFPSLSSCLEIRKQLLSFPRRTFAPLLPSPDGSRFARLFCQASSLPSPCGRVYRPSADDGAIGVLAPRPLGVWLERDRVALCRVTSGLTLSRAPSAAGFFFVFARLQRQLSRAVRV